MVEEFNLTFYSLFQSQKEVDYQVFKSLWTTGFWKLTLVFAANFWQFDSLERM